MTTTTATLRLRSAQDRFFLLGALADSPAVTARERRALLVDRLGARAAWDRAAADLETAELAS